MSKTKKKVKRRKGNKAGKGAAFERKLCKDLSLWWSGRERRDDIFWRTSQSGGRATTRAKSGRATYGQSGDVAAIDPIGTALIKLVTIEAKCGYKNSGTPFDWLGGFGDDDKHMWTRWIKQTIKSKEQAGTPYWLLVVRQTNRRAVVVYPYAFHVQFDINLWFAPHMILSGVEFLGNSAGGYRRLVAAPFDVFLESLSAYDIKRFCREA